ncbi:hypothetical protein [Desulfoluna sp.]|uniref:hypothetical protein n=1 Tax=Desulfoluna sp. TaxID=2045199 RepID=UPI002613EF2B|nr:hypothetical protein [Desulfoluna sp.]
MIAKYLTISGMIATVAWFLWNPVGWVFEWEPIVAFIMSLAGFVTTEYQDYKSKKGDARNSKDKELFERFCNLLPSNEVMEFIRYHDFLTEFKREKIQPLSDFSYEWDNAEHKFLNKKIEKCRENFLSAVHEFKEHIAEYTCPNNNGLQAVRVDSQKHDSVQEKRFRTEASIINKSANKLYDLHQQLISLGRSKLT